METNFDQMNFDDCGTPYTHISAELGREFHPGDQVRMVNCVEAEKYAGRIWTVASEPWEVCGSRVVLLEEFRGGFDCERLELT